MSTREHNQRTILACFLVPRDFLMTTSTENYKNETIGSYDNHYSRLYWDNDRIDLAGVIPLNDLQEQLSFRLKILRHDMKNLNFVKEEPLLNNKNIGNAESYSTRSFLVAPIMENFKNPEEFLSKKHSVDIKSMRKTPSRRISNVKFRKLKRSVNLLDMKTSYRRAATKSRKQRLKSSISNPISIPSDNQCEDSSDMASNIDSWLNMKVVKKLGKEIRVDGQRSYTLKKKKRGFFRKRLLGIRNRTVNKQEHCCQEYKTDISIRSKNPDLYAKNDVNHSQKAIDFSDQRPSILIDKNNLTSENFGQDLEKIIKPLEFRKSPEYLDPKDYRKLIYLGSQNCLPISDNLNSEQTTKHPPILLDSVSIMESVSSPISNLSSIENLDIISSSPLAQSTPRLFSRYSRNSEENDNYKANLDFSLIMESLHKRTIFLDENSAYERSISKESSKQEFINRRDLLARSREPKMMKKHPSPSKLELDRLQQELGRLS